MRLELLIDVDIILTYNNKVWNVIYVFNLEIKCLFARNYCRLWIARNYCGF